LMLAVSLGVDAGPIEQSLPVPAIIVFSGHMIDQPGRIVPRFPEELESVVHESILERLRRFPAVVGYSAAACGSAILFIESVLECGGAPHVVLPFEREEFCRASVDVVPGSPWRARFDAALSRASEVTTVSRQSLSLSGLSCDYANQVLLGLAQLHADR